MRTTLVVGALFAFPGVARSAPSPLDYSMLPAVLPGMSVALAPFVTMPPDAGNIGAPLARIQTDLNGVVYRTSTAGAAPSAWFNLAAQLGTAAVDDGDTSHGLMSIAFHPNFNGNPALPGFGKFYTSSNGAPGAAMIAGRQPVRRPGGRELWLVAAGGHLRDRLCLRADR